MDLENLQKMHLQRIFVTEGLDVITSDMPDAVTIPGAVAGWSFAA